MKKFTLLLLAVMAFASCKKSHDLTFPPAVIDFFSDTSNIDPGLKLVMADIQQQDKQSHFLSTFLNDNGKPYWKKTVFDTSTYIIPFSSNNEVKAILLAKRLSYGYFYKAFYRNTLIYPSADTEKKVAGLFGYFEKSVNGKDTIRMNGWELYDVSVSIPRENSHRPEMVQTTVPANQVDIRNISSTGGRIVIEVCVYGRLAPILPIPVFPKVKIDPSLQLHLRPEAVMIAIPKPVCQYIIIEGGTTQGGTQGYNGTGSGTMPGTGAGGGGTVPDYNIPGSGPCPTCPKPVEVLWYQNVPLKEGTVAMNKLKAILAVFPNLNTAQKQWILDAGVLDDINNAITRPLILFGDEIPVSIDERNMSLAMMIVAGERNKFGVFDAEHWNLIELYGPGPILINPAVWIANVKYKAIVLKEDHPEWIEQYNGPSSKRYLAKVYWEATKEIWHDVLTGIGLVPVFGEVADLLDGSLYLIDGDGVNASLSFASAIPIWGWGTAAIKVGKRVFTTSLGVRTALRWQKGADGLVRFGDRNQLRKVLGLASTVLDKRLAHHIIPIDVFDNALVQKAAQIVSKPGVFNNSFHLNELINGIPLDATIHSGAHTAYNATISARLTALATVNRNATPEQARVIIENVIGDVRNWLSKNPGVNIDNFKFPK